MKRAFSEPPIHEVAAVLAKRAAGHFIPTCPQFVLILLLQGPRELADDELKRKAKCIVDEFVTNCDAESAYNDVCTDFHPTNMAKVAEGIISHVLEKTKDILQTLKMAGQLLDSLVKKNVLLPQNMVEAVSNTIEFGSDMEIDIPKFWEYLGAIIGKSVWTFKRLQIFLLLRQLRVSADLP